MSALNPIFIIGLSTGLIFIVTAILTRRYPPKGINHIYGYRTKSSMLSQERWDFAQTYSSILMQRYGYFLVLFGLIGYFVAYSEAIDTLISISLIIFFTITLFVKTEKAIRDRFGDIH